MEQYLLQIVGMAILTTVFSLLAPEKKLKKPIEGVLKLCMLTVLFSPVFLFFTKEQEIFSLTEINLTDETYVEQSRALAVKKYAEEEYGVTVRVEISENFLDVYILDFGMIEENRHINIQNELSGGIKKLCADKEVRVYDKSD